MCECVCLFLRVTNTEARQQAMAEDISSSGVQKRGEEYYTKEELAAFAKPKSKKKRKLRKKKHQDADAEVSCMRCFACTVSVMFRAHAVLSHVCVRGVCVFPVVCHIVTLYTGRGGSIRLVQPRSRAGSTSTA